MSNPEWLGQVQKFDVPATGEGQSETGGALSTVADALAQETKATYQVGQAVAATIERDSDFFPGALVMFVYSGDDVADIQRLAERYQVTSDKVTLMSAAAAIEKYTDGVAVCTIVNVRF